MKTTESSQSGDALLQGGLNVCRRFLLRGLSMWPIAAPVANVAWWLKATPAVVLRDGWVLSKDD